MSSFLKISHGYQQGSVSDNFDPLTATGRTSGRRYSRHVVAEKSRTVSKILTDTAGTPSAVVTISLLPMGD